jgi:homoserine kinase
MKKVFAPATVANVACGFDIFGFAIDAPGDEVVARRLKRKKGVHITKIKGDSGLLPKDPQKNTAGAAVSAFLERLRISDGVELEVHKKMPLECGLGSSGASAVAAVVAVNALFGDPLEKKELLPFVVEAEKVACGASHADNVGGSLLGGFIVVRSYDPLDVIQVPTPTNLTCVIVHPEMVLPTADARRVLPENVSLSKMITQSGNASALIVGLMTANYSLIARSLDDVIIEPRRRALIKGFDQVKEAALKQGALGCSISGAGPSVFALCSSIEEGQVIGRAMQSTWKNNGVRSTIFVSKINQQGACLV